VTTFRGAVYGSGPVTQGKKEGTTADPLTRESGSDAVDKASAGWLGDLESARGRGWLGGGLCRGIARRDRPLGTAPPNAESDVPPPPPQIARRGAASASGAQAGAAGCGANYLATLS